MDPNFLMKNRSSPLVIQGIRTNPQGITYNINYNKHVESLNNHISFTDAESHILFFDIEGLIFELHSEEYSKMVQNTLEAAQKTDQHGSDTGKKISG